MSNKKFSAVIVEDGLEYIEIIKAAMVMNGRFHFQHFENGWDAFNYLKDQEKVDLLITDIVMPKMDGLQMVERLKDIRRLPPTIFLSMKSEDSFVSKAMSLGALDYIKKPFSPMQLLEKINQFAKAKDAMGS